MKRPRFSLAEIMVATAAVGAEIALLRSVLDEQWPGWLAGPLVVASPMSMALAYGFYIRITRAKLAFLDGFLSIGGICTTLLVLAVLPGSGAFYDYVNSVAEPIDVAALHVLGMTSWTRGGLKADSVAFWFIEQPILLVLYSAPAAVPAVLGGWLFGRYRIRITIERRRPSVSANLDTPEMASSTAVTRCAPQGRRHAMKRLRFSLGGFMLAIAAIGAEIALIRSEIENRWPAKLGEALAVASPMILALSYGFYRRISRPESHFWRGFLPVGALSTFALFLAIWFESTIVAEYVRNALEPIDDYLRMRLVTQGRPTGNSAAFWCIELPILLALYSAPAAVPAVLAGWFLGRYRLRITIERRWPSVSANPETLEMASSAAVDP